jgi:hypothetical protein
MVVRPGLSHAGPPRHRDEISGLQTRGDFVERDKSPANPGLASGILQTCPPDATSPNQLRDRSRTAWPAAQELIATISSSRSIPLVALVRGRRACLVAAIDDVLGSRDHFSSRSELADFAGVVCRVDDARGLAGEAREVLARGEAVDPAIHR